MVAFYIFAVCLMGLFFTDTRDDWMSNINYALGTHLNGIAMFIVGFILMFVLETIFDISKQVDKLTKDKEK